MIAMLVVGSALAAPQAALKTTAQLPRTVVAPGEPVHLYVAMENRTDRKLSFEKHSWGPCYAAKFVKIVLTPEAALKDLPEDCSAPVENVSPGERVEFLIDLREMFVLDDSKDYGIRVEWRDGGPEIYSPLTSRAGHIRFTAPFFEARVPKGETIFLPNKNAVIFRGHQSKPSDRRGEPPKLVIDFMHQIRNEGEVEALVPVALNVTRQFDFGGYRFDVQHHQFDQWMQLRIFE